MFGITEKVARAHGYEGLMSVLPIDVASDIAKEQYWDIMRLDDVAALSLSIAQEMFDTGILCGQNKAVEFLQRSLNVMNKEQHLFGDMKVDGLMGLVSIDSLRMFLLARRNDGERAMLKALNCLQGAYFFSITEAREANEEFFIGWITNRVEL